MDRRYVFLFRVEGELWNVVETVKITDRFYEKLKLED